MISDTMNDPSLWNNDYPIVLVHGYCGSTMDENWIVGGYFHYAFSQVTQYLNCKDENGKRRYMKNVYEVDISPIGSTHDRACELYQ